VGIFSDIGGAIGDIAGAFSGGGADDAQQQFYKDLIAKYGKLDPTITAETVGPSALGSAGGDSRAAQLDALKEMQGIYRTGGLDAISKGQIAEADAGANRNAQANRNSVLESARARGAGRSGVTLALQQAGGQEAMGDSNLAASRAAATSEGNRRGAIAGAAGTAGTVRAQDYQAAAAQDQINQFNAAMKTGAQQATFGNEMGQLGAEGGAYSPVYASGKANEGRVARLYGSIGRLAGSAGDAFAKTPGMPSWMQNDPTGGAGYT
jgi:hypothetical protein